MASAKCSKIEKLYEKKKKEIEKLRTQLDESEKDFQKIKKLYDKQLNWEKTGDLLQQEVDDYLAKHRKHKDEIQEESEQEPVTEESRWGYEE
ncbi:hypothetical protein Aargi30884_15320 [Amedibacterium intestinale]|uniref:Uncharacterized protein n=1 Tax=Amedibacterium intestinale TaxID=2583452 RepID=A0A6N4TIQ7_9FIRM|nr:hypothetical protein [Amedibacterium intestinale]BBK22629.1 hypothetical protein Aargi30884_15320 [Amedibacterium intestinale]